MVCGALLLACSIALPHPPAARLYRLRRTTLSLMGFYRYCGRVLFFAMQGKGLFFVNDTESSYRLKLFLEQFHVRSAVLNAELPLNSRLHILQVRWGGVAWEGIGSRYLLRSRCTLLFLWLFA